MYEQAYKISVKEKLFTVKKKYLTPIKEHSIVFKVDKKVISMEEKILQGYLYDFYGELLNEHQRRIFEDYVFQDLSLGEIAQEEGISRQGVHDLIKRCTKSLQGYEEKLHLLEKFMEVKDNVKRIHELAESATEQNYTDIMHEIQKVSNDILEEL